MALKFQDHIFFIEYNPVRMRLIEQAENYPWLSARSNVTGTPDPMLTEGCFLKDAVLDRRAYLASAPNEGVVRRTWERLKTGRPAGDEGFVHGLEELTGRRLAALPRGRPRKVVPTR